MCVLRTYINKSFYEIFLKKIKKLPTFFFIAFSILHNMFSKMDSFDVCLRAHIDPKLNKRNKLQPV